MGKRPPRYSLNAKQVRVLKLLYKFRFVTTSLLARYKGVSRISSNKALKILLDQQYLGEHFDKSFKIQGRGPSYYLAPKALTYLRDHHKLNEQVLHALYKNKTVSQGFIDHHLDALAAYLALRDSYPDTFHIFTKNELGGYDYFPEPKPDLYLNRINPLDNGQNEYILDIFADTQYFVLKKRFAALLEHFESGDWEADAETDYPVVLLVCPDSRIEDKLLTHIAKVFDNSGIDDLKVFITTTKALISSRETTRAIWSDVQDPKTLLSL